MPSALNSAAQVRVIMLRAALAMLVCGWQLLLLLRQKIPSIEETLITQEGEVVPSCLVPVILHFSWLIRWKGTTELTTWVVQQSSRGTSSMDCTQELVRRLSVGCPNSSSWSRDTSSGRMAMLLAKTLGKGSPVAVRITTACWSCQDSIASCQFCISRAQNWWGRTMVWAALLMRMSSLGTCSLMQATSWSTCCCERKSHCTICSLCFHTSQSSCRQYRISVSLAKREVTQTRAPSLSSFKATSNPILMRPPVTRAVSPDRSTTWFRLVRLNCAQVGHKYPQSGWIQVYLTQQMWQEQWQDEFWELGWTVSFSLSWASSPLSQVTSPLGLMDACLPVLVGFLLMLHSNCCFLICTSFCLLVFFEAKEFFCFVWKKELISAKIRLTGGRCFRQVVNRPCLQIRLNLPRVVSMLSSSYCCTQLTYTEFQQKGRTSFCCSKLTSSKSCEEGGT